MDVLTAIRTRKSIRRYLGDPVAKEDLMAILDAARMAPSGGNLQPWHFIVAESRRTISAIAAMVRKRIDEFATANASDADLLGIAERYRAHSLYFEGAPVVILVLTTGNPFAGPLLSHLRSRGLSDYEACREAGLVEILSVAAAVQNLLLAAHALGYGACWMNVPFVAKADLFAMFGIRPPWDLTALVPMGRPATGVHPQPGRKPLEGIVTFA
jgi:nitroreductase